MPDPVGILPIDETLWRATKRTGVIDQAHIDAAAESAREQIVGAAQVLGEAHDWLRGIQEQVGVLVTLSEILAAENVMLRERVGHLQGQPVSMPLDTE